MRRFFCFRREENETSAGCCTRTAKIGEGWIEKAQMTVPVRTHCRQHVEDPGMGLRRGIERGAGIHAALLRHVGVRAGAGGER